MSFPVVFHLGPVALPAHLVFELLAYFAGFRLYLRERRRSGDALDDPRRLWIVAAAALGAFVGARLLYLAESPAETLARWREPEYLLGGKTIVGGLAGGWLAVEMAKRALAIESRTGDLFAVPLALAIALGRIGCFLGGLDDRTFGVATTLPWGVDFGDGVARHPTQLYESLFCLALAFGLARFVPRRTGDRFRLFAFAYFAFRFAIDFLKPTPALALGLSAIQWVALVACGVALPDILRIRKRTERRAR